MKVQKVKPELITHWALCHIQSDVWMLSEVAVVTLKCFKVPRMMCGGCMKTLYVLYKTHEHSQVVSVTGSWNHFAKAWRVKGIQFTLFSWMAELGLGPNAWTQVPVCLVTGLGCISCDTGCSIEWVPLWGSSGGREHFYLRGRAWRTQRCPKEVARKLNKRARIQPRRLVTSWEEGTM